jgi:hypothetical protein
LSGSIDLAGFRQSILRSTALGPDIRFPAGERSKQACGVPIAARTPVLIEAVGALDLVLEGARKPDIVLILQQQVPRMPAR